jgi:hypothetical protein
MARPIAYHPNSTSSLSKVLTASPPRVAMMIAMAESRLVPAVSRSVRYEIQPITRPQKTAPSPVINMSFLLVLTLSALWLASPLAGQRTGAQASDEESVYCSASHCRSHGW